MLLCKLPAFFGFRVGATTLTLTLALALGLLLSPVAHAHPVWHDLNSRSSVDSFITGSTFLRAGGVKFGGVPHYLTTPLPSAAGSTTGNLTVSPQFSSDDGAPLLFSVHDGQLLHHTNESHFLYVNAMNVTLGAMNGSPLFRLTLASQRDGLLDAVLWRWRGEYLYLDDGQKSNNGLYYKCVSKPGGEGIYTSFDIISSPECRIVTLYSFNIAADEAEQRLLSP